MQRMWKQRKRTTGVQQKVELDEVTKLELRGDTARRAAVWHWRLETVELRASCSGHNIVSGW